MSNQLSRRDSPDCGIRSVTFVMPSSSTVTLSHSILPELDRRCAQPVFALV